MKYSIFNEMMFSFYIKIKEGVLPYGVLPFMADGLKEVDIYDLPAKNTKRKICILSNINISNL